MLPSSLQSLYQEYKQDTNAIASWLASTALANGYSKDSLLSQGSKAAASGSAGRLKGKARKEAKKAAPVNSAASSPDRPPKHIIALRDFANLSTYIIDKTKVVIPSSVSTTLARLIAIRDGFGDKLEEHNQAPTPASDARHVHFVDILRKVQQTLSTRPESTASTTSQKASDESLDNLANRFHGLDVFEPSEAFLAAPDAPRPEPASGSTDMYEAETPQDPEDVLFEVYMILKDLNKIRGVIKWIWSNYKHVAGCFSLSAAAISTNTAIDLARNISEELVSLASKIGGVWAALERCFMLEAMTRGASLDELISNRNPTDNLNYDFYDVSIDTFFTTHRLVEAFADVLEPKILPIYKEGMFGEYDPWENRDRKAGYGKFEEDRALLMPIFTELMSAIRGVKDYPVQDEFLRGMGELSQTGKVPFYLTFSAQVLLDIHHVLREDGGLPFRQLEKQSKFLLDEMEKHLVFHQNLKIVNWPAVNDTVLKAFMEMIKWVLHDPVYDAKEKAYKQLKMTVPATVERNRILKLSPVLSGLMLFRFESEYRKLGQAVMDAWGSLLFTGHLYNALRSEKLLGQSTWSDMDLAMALIGIDNFFVGDAPTNKVDYFKRFNVQTGVSVAAMSKTRRQATATASKAGPRGLKYTYTATVNQLFIERYANAQSSRAEWTAEHIQQIIDQSNYEAVEDHEDGTVTYELKDVRPWRSATTKRKTSKAKQKGTALPAEQLVKLLTLALQAEEVEFTFPWLAMHRSCWQVLRDVRDATDSNLRAKHGPAYLEQENQLPFVVAWIFESLSPQFGPSDVTFLEDAAKAVIKYADQSSGRQCIDLLGEQGKAVEFEDDRESAEQDGQEQEAYHFEA